MYRGINIVDMYEAGDYPFNEYPDFVTFKKYLSIAKNDLNCDFIRLFLLRDFEGHYPDWVKRWVAVENLIQQYNFTVEYCTYMFWDTTTIDINAYKNWVYKYIGIYKALAMPTNRIWIVNILENLENYTVAQIMMPYFKLIDPDRTVTTEVWATLGGMYNGEIIGLPSSKSDSYINNRIYIQNNDLISTADYFNSLPSSDLWRQLKLQAPTNSVLLSEFSDDITNKVNIAKQNGAYGVCYWDMHLTDTTGTPINSDYTLNSKGIELQAVYRSLTAAPAQASISPIFIGALAIGLLMSFILSKRNNNMREHHAM